MSIKKILVILSILLTFLLPVSSVKATEEKVIKVGYFGYAGFIEKDKNDQFVGYGVDYLQEVAKHTGWKYEFVYATWSELLTMLEEGNIDLLCTAQKSPDRLNRFNYSKLAAGYETGSIYTYTSNDLYYEDFEAFSSMTFGMLKDSYQNEAFAAYAKKNNFTYNTKYYDYVAELEKALNQGEIDAFIDGSLRKSTKNKVVARFSVDPFYFITNKKDETLMPLINDALTEIRFMNPNYASELQIKHYGDSVSNRLLFSAEEFAYINSKPILHVGVKNGEPPIEYYDKAESRYRGITIDIITEIFKKLGIQVKFVPIDSQERIDIISSKIIEEIKPNEHPIITDAYFKVHNVMVVNKESNKTVYKIGVLSDDKIVQSKYLETYYKDYKQIKYNSVREALNAIANQSVDFIIAFNDSVNMFITEDTYKNLQIIDLEGLTYSIALGIDEQANPLLTSILNKGIHSISQVEKNNLLLRANSTVQEKASFKELLIKNWQAILIVVLLILIAIFYAISVTRRRMSDKLAVLAYTDSLLNCYNRIKFVNEAEYILYSTNSRYALLYFNIVNFRSVNNHYGRANGDELLKYVYKCLSEEVKTNKLVARSSTDHFIILFPYQELIEVEKWINEITEKTHALISVYNTPIFINSKIGVYLIQDRNEAIDSMIEKASFACKSLKHQDINKFTYFNDSLMDKSSEEEQLTQMIEEAIENHEFKMYLQPKYHIENHKIYGAEALVRWQSASKGLLLPNAFIPLFERNGLVTKIDMIMFEEVCKFQKIWLQEKREPILISCNMSRIHFDNPEYLNQLRRIVEKYEIPFGCIEIEITESAFIGDDDLVIKTIHDLQSLGFLISIDDFGSGYSSLNILYRAKPDTIKLDKRFLVECAISQRSKIIVKKIVEMALLIGLSVICEGVEEEYQEQFLLEIDCENAQGFLFCVPIPADEFKAKF